MQVLLPEVLPTGFSSLDQALGGGIPRGRIVEIFGPSNSGKTTLGLQIFAQAQRYGLTTVWVDADRTFDVSYAAALGVNCERMPVLQPESAEDALAMFHELARTRAVDLLVVDSTAALVPLLELEAEVGAQSPGLHARVLASGLRTLARLAANVRMSAIFLDQTRSRVYRAGDVAEDSASGPALKLHAAIRIALGSPCGNRTPFRIEKNKVAHAFSTGALVRSIAPGFAAAP